ncbi:gamma-aminobutyric acid type B receptor subunit 1-like [Dysidea avara]|uniref:gamma-aminobutyric acid type B receptor subunit 1-like n=1 Tax=Dysidea avara TaxID=196820 RepID=UPI0033268E5E
MKLFLLLFLQTSVLLVVGDSDGCDTDTSGSGGDLIDLHIIGFFPCTHLEDQREYPVDNCDGIDRIPIMKLALEEINERCDLLPGYRLVVDYANSGCASIPATYHLIQQTDPGVPTKLMILGPACSIASELMGEVAQKFINLTQVAYTASSSLFGKDKVRFPRFYRLVPITEQITDGYVALVEKLNWKRVTVITDEDELNLNAGIHTEEMLTEKRILTRLTFTDDPREVVEIIEDLRARIFITWIHPSVAVQFWCKVVRRKLAGPDFVWFIPGWFRANWWAAVDGTDCSAEEMERSLEHTLGGLGNSILDYDPDRVLASEKTVAQFKQDLDKKNEMLGPVNTDIFLNIGYVYDAAWTIALALNASISVLEEKGIGRLEEYQTEWTEMSDVLTQSVANVSFEGISGKVSFFKQSGNRIDPSVRIVQYRDGVAVPIIVYVPSQQNDSLIELPGQSLVWQGGFVPRDAPNPVTQHHFKVEIIIAAVITAIGILSTAFFLSFNVYYRKNLVVKRSSYCLNCVIISAILMGFIGTALYTIELDNDTSEVASALVCNLRYWMTELAFVISFATFFMKIWRLYKLFFNENLSQRKYLDDQYLLLGVGVITTPALVVLIVQASIYPITLHSRTKINKDNLAQEEITYICKAKHHLIFDLVLIVIRTVLGIFSLTITFQIKKYLPTERRYRKYHD